MSRRNRSLLSIAAFIAVDVLAVGAGMGVPIFAIALGLPTGWLLPGFLGIHSPYPSSDISRLLRACAIASSLTFVLLSVIWLPTLRLLADPTADLADFGIPMILYKPLASFIGWLVLMVFISPFLQVLTILFGAALRCAFRPPSGHAPAVA